MNLQPALLSPLFAHKQAGTQQRPGEGGGTHFDPKQIYFFVVYPDSRARAPAVATCTRVCIQIYFKQQKRPRRRSWNANKASRPPFRHPGVLPLPTTMTLESPMPVVSPTPSPWCHQLHPLHGMHFAFLCLGKQKQEA